MVNYLCFRCGYTNKNKTNFIKHLNRKLICDPNKKDVNIEIDKDTFKVSYSKDNEDENLDFNYHYKGIAKRAFNLGYKVSAKYNLSNASAEMKDGLLKISIPHAEKTEAQVIDIK